MYEINVSTRRVTQFVVDEAYKWLYQQVLSGQYSANRCKAGKSLLLRIEEDGGVTKDTYQQFLDLFDNSLFGYMLYRSKRKRSTKMTTDNLCCYFAQFNGEVLPIGFIKDFFEDDYETSQEVYELLEKFGASERSEMSIKWKKILIQRENAIDGLRTAFPSMLKLHPVLLISYLLKLALTATMVWLLVVFCQSVDLISVVKSVIANKFDLSLPIVASRDITAYFLGDGLARAGETFDVLEYLRAYSLFFAFNILLLLVVLVRIKRAIRFLTLVIRVIANNVRLLMMNLLVRIFEKNSIESVGNYFTETMTGMAQQGEVTDQDCAGIPKSMQLYSTIARFDAERMSAKFAVKVAKYMEYGLAYQPTPESLRKAKRGWKRGIVMTVIFVLIAAVVNLPDVYDMVIPKVLEAIAEYL